MRIAIVAAIPVGLWFGLQRTQFDRGTRLTTWLIVVVPLLAWFALVWQLALAGVFATSLGAIPVVVFAIVLPMVIGIPLLIRWRRLAEVIDVTPSAWLVGLQAYRIFGVAFLVQWGLGRLPVVFLPSGIGDLLVGRLALPVALYLQSGARSSRSVAVVWNVFGILDLIMAISPALLAGARLGYPVIMTPAFTLPLSAILHVLSLWQLKRAAQPVRLPMQAASVAG